MTFAEKALAGASGQQEVRAGQVVTVQPHLVMSHDNTADIIRIFRQIGVGRVRHPERLAIVLDHASPAPTTRHAQNHVEIRDFVQEQGIRYFFDVGRGICHQVLIEEGLVLPGQVILGADSHSTHYGAVGAFGAGVGRSEMAAIWATGELWLQVPESIKITVHGTLPRGVTAKDLALHIIGTLGADGGLYVSVELSGPAIEVLSLESRMVLPNMLTEMGVKNAYLPPDVRMIRWLAQRLACRTGDPVDDCARRIADAALYPDPDADYAAEYHFDAGSIEPQTARPHAVDNVVPLSQAVGTRIHQAFIGSCSNGRLEDIAAAAEMVQGRRLAPGTRLLVIPASSRVYLEALRLGYIETLLRAGAVIGPPGCGPCMGNHLGVLAPGEVCISSANRNFRGRMGTPDAEIYLASPAVVAASAIAGRIVSPVRDAEAERSGGAKERENTGAREPGSGGAGEPGSSGAEELLNSRETFSPPPRLLRTMLVRRKYGDNVNTDVIFPGKYTYTLTEPAEMAAHAMEDLDPTFAAEVQPGDVIVAGHNFGCGSSREQAVTSLKYAGVGAIIAASFARIFYRNAINNGLPAIACPEAAAAIEPGEEIQIDLATGMLRCAAGTFRFPPLPPSVRAILDAGGLIPYLIQDSSSHISDPKSQRATSNQQRGRAWIYEN
ncbi:MAG TPA: homoaconitate hydratase family protein [Anaerolineae bacterium]|nr:homoaconitate hydratase family protein [Anaerolineae bacterium]